MFRAVLIQGQFLQAVCAFGLPSQLCRHIDNEVKTKKNLLHFNLSLIEEEN